jgi:DNA-binding FrmR family transcriptional regulator
MDCKAHCSYQDSKSNILRRLKKIEGQIKGIQKMVSEEKYCVDILIQMAAVRAALNRAGLIIFEDHTKGCVLDALNTEKRDEKISELVDVIFKFIR